ncbi:uncharacterized protein LACBIDRAFT_308924 [Laccaria bicolor S238N-H82]|uniref:Predicted protein n=1 Tax=Laccaria bicolor (strain S238N-H82 / ATCC MYA-4686) TaxID=486041 RepID=B0CV36_LACBS|nr:uncharacterized protein LACBIDRAFT_308924 [Laccaria bicolor S238N-H82]EDR13260.1 predicted protein [Laccaria bicolor S238N-H82]|eukprot:XP_001875758.1 predicted protein [Laccaria bicolor S238N-H82]
MRNNHQREGLTSNGQLIQPIQPPRAILPLDASGHLNLSSITGPTTGRTGNKGFEGLTYDDNTKTLYAMLQSATIQDGGSAKTTNRYTRLLAFNLANPIITPKLVREWVVPLPQSSKRKAQACSEIHFISPGIFLALSRDGNGRGGDDAKSGYKQADLFSISKATDIHNTKFDDPANPISPGGVLDPSITPAEYVSFVNYLDKTQPPRFGLHNGHTFSGQPLIIITCSISPLAFLDSLSIFLRVYCTQYRNIMGVFVFVE